MIPRAATACLLALVLVPSCRAAGMKTKTRAKTKDPWDVPDGSEDAQAAPEGGSEGDMSPEDQAGILQEVAQRSAVHRAHSQHAVMKQFMSNFANNMRLSVLADSQGDMPEEQRQKLIAQAEASKQRNSGEDEGGPPQEASDDQETAPPPQPQRQASHRGRMLNMAEARHRQQQRLQQERMQQERMHRPHHRLLPEAEGIGFPAPEGMAPDPATDGMVNDPGMTSEGASRSYDAAPAEDEAPPPPRRQRHHVRMLNMRPGEHRQALRRHPHAPREHAPDSHKSAHGQKLPPGVVRDEMGRAMPVLFFGSKPTHSGSLAQNAPLAAMAVLYLCVMHS